LAMRLPDGRPVARPSLLRLCPHPSAVGEFAD
jgi:hypothetical protein